MDLSAGSIGITVSTTLLTLPLEVWQRAIEVGGRLLLCAEQHPRNARAQVAVPSWPRCPTRLHRRASGVLPASKKGMTAIVRHIVGRGGAKDRANAVATGGVPRAADAAVHPEKTGRVLSSGNCTARSPDDIARCGVPALRSTANGSRPDHRSTAVPSSAASVHRQNASRLCRRGCATARGAPARSPADAITPRRSALASRCTQRADRRIEGEAHREAGRQGRDRHGSRSAGGGGPGHYVQGCGKAHRCRVVSTATLRTNAGSRCAGSAIGSARRIVRHDIDAMVRDAVDAFAVAAFL